MNDIIAVRERLRQVLHAQELDARNLLEQQKLIDQAFSVVSSIYVELNQLDWRTRRAKRLHRLIPLARARAWRRWRRYGKEIDRLVGVSNE